MAKHVRTFIFTDESLAELEELKKYFGFASDSQLFRFAGRVLQSLGMHLPAEGKRILLEDKASGEIGEIDILDWAHRANPATMELEKWFSSKHEGEEPAQDKPSV